MDNSNVGLLIPGIFIGSLVILGALLISLLISLWKIRRKYEELISGASGQNVEKALMAYMEATRRAEARLSSLEDRMAKSALEAGTHLQNTGVVRYNAFEGVGGEQSFSLAILGDDGNGFTLTGIYGHAETRVYAKPIEKYSSKYLLSPEESKAIEEAMQKAGK